MSVCNAVHPWETRKGPFYMKQQCVYYEDIESRLVMMDNVRDT